MQSKSTSSSKANGGCKIFSQRAHNTSGIRVLESRSAPKPIFCFLLGGSSAAIAFSGLNEYRTQLNNMLEPEHKTNIGMCSAASVPNGPRNFHLSIDHVAELISLSACCATALSVTPNMQQQSIFVDILAHGRDSGFILNQDSRQVVANGRPFPILVANGFSPSGRQRPTFSHSCRQRPTHGTTILN